MLCPHAIPTHLAPQTLFYIYYGSLLSEQELETKVGNIDLMINSDPVSLQLMNLNGHTLKEHNALDQSGWFLKTVDV